MMDNVMVALGRVAVPAAGTAMIGEQRGDGCPKAGSNGL